MQTLSKGVKKPQTGDGGVVFWSALASNAQIQNDHAHNGSDSALVVSSDVVKGQVAVPATGWTLDAPLYYQSVTMPDAFTWGAIVRVYLHSDGNEIQASLVRVSDTVFKVYMPMNNVAVDLIFT